MQSAERAMAITCMIGWAPECDPYPKPETLLKARAIMEGMPELAPDDTPNDPIVYLGEENAQYLESWHLKRLSSARAEFAGAKGIRGYFSSHEGFSFERCKSDEALAEMKVKAEKLLKGKLMLFERCRTCLVTL